MGKSKILAHRGGLLIQAKKTSSSGAVVKVVGAGVVGSIVNGTVNQARQSINLWKVESVSSKEERSCRRRGRMTSRCGPRDQRRCMTELSAWGQFHVMVISCDASHVIWMGYKRYTRYITIRRQGDLWRHESGQVGRSRDVLSRGTRWFGSGSRSQLVEGPVIGVRGVSCLGTGVIRIT